MTTTVHISDFKDFTGLQEACVYFKVSMIYSSFNFYIYEGVNPYEEAYRFQKGDIKTNKYSKAIGFAEENSFNASNVKSDLNSLIADSSFVLNRLMSLCSYPEGHIRRVY